MRIVFQMPCLSSASPENHLGLIGGFQPIRSGPTTNTPLSKKENDGEINGMKIGGVNWDATDEDGPCRVSLSFIDIGDDKVITLLYWGSTAAEKKHGKDLKFILNSMQKLKGEKAAKKKEPAAEEEGEEEESADEDKE